MFKISPIQDKELQKNFAKQCDIDFCPELFAYSMINQDDETLMGMSQFDIKGEYGYIHSLKSKSGYSDFEAMFILGRATMNFIDICGSHCCYASADGADEILLKSIGFKKLDSGEFYADMNGMFEGKCDGHPVNLNDENN